MTNKLVGTFTSLILIALISIVFCSIDVNAAQYSLTLSISNTNPTVNVSPTTTGAFAKSDDVTISASTTNATGYTLSIKGANSNYNQLINSSSGSNEGSSNSNGDSSSYLTSISTATTEEQFKALDADPDTYNNRWGYRPEKLNSLANTAYLPAPNTNTGDIIETTNTANTTANTYTLALGARVDSNISIGTYSNTYIVTLVAEAVPYTITYIDNTIANFPVDVNNAKTESSTVAISNNTPSKEGYSFINWCTVVPTTTSTSTGISTDNCTGGTVYSPGSTFTIDQTSTASNNLTLYAMWQELTLQTFTNQMCSTFANNNHYALKDARDGKTYTVRYINGNCWMTQNLAIEPGTHMTAGDTNITASQYNNTGYYSLPGEGYDLKDNGTSEENCYGNTTPSGAGYVNACTHLPGVSDISKSNISTTELGAWYNYVAATTSTVTGISNANEAVYSICPKNWALPNSTQISNIANYASIFNIIYSGRYSGGSYYNGVPIWWSSTNNPGFNNATRYFMGYDETNSHIKLSNTYRFNGHNIRCIANNS